MPTKYTETAEGEVCINGLYQPGDVLGYTMFIQKIHEEVLSQYIRQKAQQSIYSTTQDKFYHHWIETVFPERAISLALNPMGDDHVLSANNMLQLANKIDALLTGENSEILLSIQLIARDLHIKFSKDKQTIFISYRERRKGIDVVLQDVLKRVLKPE